MIYFFYILYDLGADGTLLQSYPACATNRHMHAGHQHHITPLLLAYAAVKYATSLLVYSHQRFQAIELYSIQALLHVILVLNFQFDNGFGFAEQFFGKFDEAQTEFSELINGFFSLRFLILKIDSNFTLIVKR